MKMKDEVGRFCQMMSVMIKMMKDDGSGKETLRSHNIACHDGESLGALSSSCLLVD